jgi:AcrR family transcriptional regulator
VGEDPHLVTPVDELTRERELRWGIAAEREERLEDPHILHLSMTKMKKSSAPREDSASRKDSAPRMERSYRMTARADAAAATGERLLAAAWKHFGTRPYEEVRLREIAADALVTEQTLLARFHSKDELLTAAYRWWAMSEKSRRDAAPVGRFPETVANVFDHYEAHGTAILRMLSQEDRIPAVRHLTDRGRDYHRDWASSGWKTLLAGLRRASRERRLTALVIATDVLVWKLLRLDMQLSRRQAEATVVEMIESYSGRAATRSRAQRCSAAH